MQPVDDKVQQMEPGGGLPGSFVLPRFARKPVRFLRRVLDGGVSMRPRSAALLVLGLAITAEAGWLVHSGRAAPVIAQASAAAGLRIVSVEVTGNSEVSKLDVVANTDLGPYRSLFSLDVHKVRDDLKKLAWVHDAKVVKSYPDRLLIEISEREPVAVWQEKKQLWLVDRSGGVIAPFDERFVNLPLMVGKGANEKSASILSIARRHPQLMAEIAAFMFVGERRWNLRLNKGPEVLLPEGGEARAFDTLAQLRRTGQLLERDITHVDLRLPERLVIGLNPGAAEKLDETMEARKKAAAKMLALSPEQRI